eukprot:1257229-Pyramimonas_sp.AAC.1
MPAGRARGPRALRLGERCRLPRCPGPPAASCPRSGLLLGKPPPRRGQASPALSPCSPQPRVVGALRALASEGIPV